MTIISGDYRYVPVRMSTVIDLLHNNRIRLNLTCERTKSSDEVINKFVGIAGQTFLKLTKDDITNKPLELS
jgi:hypothetical protein